MHLPYIYEQLDFAFILAQDCSEWESHSIAHREAWPDPKTKCFSVSVLIKADSLLRGTELPTSIMPLFWPLLKHSWGRCLPVKRKARVKCCLWALSFNVLFNINITLISRNENRQRSSPFPYYKVTLPLRHSSLPLAQQIHYNNLGWVAGGIPFLEEGHVLD